ncbi:MAG: mannose-1-phosphate guanylyltransferase/mannose-6-phosphate isomerase [Candidatus Omnitrophica bacterium]|jgi:mannose-1-phosphate guanylyltransferase/mannose-6-phosphate isomerase|nr:mannose-1-phosphate guanylyltransferase/mannose-6-phosphate isomerase [Candidatus Omnitrophota bacterium]
MNYAVILAGGVGSRFWPFSRQLEPKQFMQIIGDKSLIQATVLRLNGIVPAENIYIVTNKAYGYEVRRQLEKFKMLPQNIILEPQGKNTASAIGLCAKLILAKDKNANLIVLPADHYISGMNGFKFTIKQALEAARKDFLVTIGIKPKYPAAGYGYIKVSYQLSAISRQLYKVEKFLEKPPLDKAKIYFKDKRFFWNSGIFVWKAQVFYEQIKRYLPGLHKTLEKINSQEDIAVYWGEIHPVSVDYGIMEHAKNIALVKAEFSWTDLGSWDALQQVFQKNKKGNIYQADCMDFDSRGICVFSRSNRLISTIGLENLIIADTPDALLICDRNKAEDVKKVVDSLQKKGRNEHIAHLTDKRPWGEYTVLHGAAGFKIKLIEISAKKRLSLQSHKHRAEHWVVVSGVAKVTSDSAVRIVRSNQSIYIPKGVKHRLENPQNCPLKIVEVQTGAYLEEDDIKRFQDDFKR